MKKLLLSLSMLFGCTVAFAAPVEAVYTADPADNSTVTESPTTITLTFSGVTKVEDGANLETALTATLNNAEYVFGGTRASNNEYYLSIPRNNPITNGTLKVTFGEGALSLDGNPNAPFTYTFTVDPTYVPTPSGPVFTPANGSVVKSLQTISVVVPGVLGQSDADVKATLVNKTTNASYSVSYPDVEGTTISATFGKAEITDPGEYVFTIPAGMYWIGSWGEEEEGNSPEYTATYTIEAPVADAVDFSSVLTQVLPDESMPADEYWEGAVTVMLTVKGEAAINASSAAKATMTLNGAAFGDALSAADSGTKIMVMPDGEETTLGLMFAEVEKPAGGTYTLTIPQGLFTIGGKPLTEYTHSWEIKAGAADINLAWNPTADGTIDLTSPDSKVVSSGSYWQNFYTTNSGLMSPYDDDFVTIEEKAILTNEDGEIIAEFSDDWSTNCLMPTNGQIRWSIQKAGATADIKKNGINTNGTYTLTIPEGFLKTAAGEPVKAQTVTWTVTGGISNEALQEYTCSPEPGEYKVYPEITLTYKDCTKIVLNGKPTAEVTLSNKTIGTFTISTDGVDKVTLTPNSEITTLAPSEFSVYRVIVPAGAYNLTINNIEAANSEVKLENVYKVATPTPDPLTIDPETGSTLASGEDLRYIYYSTEQTVTFDAAKKARLYTVVDGERSAEPIASYNRTAYDANKGEFYMAANEDGSYPELAEGTYQLVFPSGFYRAVIGGASRSSEEQVLTYIISSVAPKEYTFKLTPEAGATLEELEDLFVEVEGAETVKVLLPLQLSNGTDKYDVVGVADGLTVDYMITTQELTDGEWTATVSASGLEIDGTEYLKVISWKFNIKTPDSVAGIFGDDTLFNVYNAAGIIIFSNGNADDLRTLAPGLYIINGKKVIIRK